MEIERLAEGEEFVGSAGEELKARELEQEDLRGGEELSQVHEVTVLRG